MAHCWRCDREGGFGATCQHCGRELATASTVTAEAQASRSRALIVVAVVVAILGAVLIARAARKGSQPATASSTTTTTRAAVLPVGTPHPGVLIVAGEVIDLSTGSRRPAPLPEARGSAGPFVFAPYGEPCGLAAIDREGAVRNLGPEVDAVATSATGQLYWLRAELGVDGIRRTEVVTFGEGGFVRAVTPPQLPACEGLAIVTVPVTRCGGELLIFETDGPRSLATGVTPIGTSGDRIVGLDNDQRLVLVEQSGNVIQLPGSTREIAAAVVSPDGRYIVAAYRQGGDLELLDVEGEPQGSTVLGIRLANPSPEFMAWAPDSSFAFISGGSVVALDPTTRTVAPVRGVLSGGPVATQR